MSGKCSMRTAKWHCRVYKIVAVRPDRPRKKQRHVASHRKAMEHQRHWRQSNSEVVHSRQLTVNAVRLLTVLRYVASFDTYEASRTDFQAARERVDDVDVLGKNACGQAVLRSIRPLDDLRRCIEEVFYS